MIVRNTSSGWHIITQTNHAFLAAAIASNLAPKYKGKFWLETLLAIFTHETLETDFNTGEKINDLGMPIDFRQNTSTKSELYEKIEEMVQKAQNKSLIVGALVAKHLLFLHDGDIKKKRIKSLCQSTIAKAKKLHAIEDSEFEKMYGVLRFSDRLSLMIVTDELPDLDRKFEINNALSSKDTHALFKDKNKFKVSPWPFEQQLFDLYLEYRILENGKFESQEEFLNTFYKATIKKKTYSFSK